MFIAINLHTCRLQSFFISYSRLMALIEDKSSIDSCENWHQSSRLGSFSSTCAHWESFCPLAMVYPTTAMMVTHHGHPQSPLWKRTASTLNLTAHPWPFWTGLGTPIPSMFSRAFYIALSVTKLFPFPCTILSLIPAMKGGRHIFDSTRRVWSKRSTVCQPTPSIIFSSPRKANNNGVQILQDYYDSLMSERRMAGFSPASQISWAQRALIRGHRSNLSQSPNDGLQIYSLANAYSLHGSSKHIGYVTA